MKLYALGLDAITFVLLFFLAVSVLGLLMGLAHMSWRARQDRREQQREDQVSARRYGSAGLLDGPPRA